MRVGWRPAWYRVSPVAVRPTVTGDSSRNPHLINRLLGSLRLRGFAPIGIVDLAGHRNVRRAEALQSSGVGDCFPGSSPGTAGLLAMTGCSASRDGRWAT